MRGKLVGDTEPLYAAFVMPSWRASELDDRARGASDSSGADEEEKGVEFEFTAETAPETTRAYVYLRYEAEMEVKRSVATWPDTEVSREAVARSSPFPLSSSPRDLPSLNDS